MKFKQSRAFSFVVIAIIYIIGTIIGIAVFRIFDASLPIKVLFGDLAATIFVFLMSLILRNASVYDPYWSVAPLVILILLLFDQKSYNLGSFLLLSAVLLWSVRLTANWAYTFQNLTVQDWRYTMLEEKSGGWFPLVNFLGIQLFPTIVVFFALLPAVQFISHSKCNIITLIGFFLSLCAFLLQLVSDIQMQRFRKTNTDKSKIIRTGLWKYARHPNYLGEILMWWGVYVMMLSAIPSEWLLLAGASINTLMFVLISIPMAEKRLATYKSDFKTYKAETRMLLPLKK